MLAIGVLLAACGGNSSSAGPGEDTPGTPADTAEPGQDGTGSGDDVTGPGEDTKPAGDKHIAWGVSWDDFWPDPSLTATYVTTPLGGGQTTELVATWKENVEWRGGTWLMLAIGEAVPGKSGMAVYIDRSEPWVAKVKGAAVFNETSKNGPFLEEWWDEPLIVDFNMAVGEKIKVESKQHTTIDGEDMSLEDMSYELTIEKVDGAITVLAGEFKDCMLLHGKIGGPFELEADIWLHPEQFGLKIDDSPLGATIELKEAWH